MGMWNDQLIHKNLYVDQVQKVVGAMERKTVDSSIAAHPQEQQSVRYFEKYVGKPVPKDLVEKVINASLMKNNWHETKPADLERTSENFSNRIKERSVAVTVMKVPIKLPVNRKSEKA